MRLKRKSIYCKETDKRQDFRGKLSPLESLNNMTKCLGEREIWWQHGDRSVQGQTTFVMAHCYEDQSLNQYHGAGEEGLNLQDILKVIFSDFND